jgi:hypothetical protein
MYSHNVVLWCAYSPEVLVAAVKTVVVVTAVLDQDHAGQLPETSGQGQSITLHHVHYMSHRILVLELCVLS